MSSSLRELSDEYIEAIVESKKAAMRDFLSQAIRHSMPTSPEAGSSGPNCQGLVATRLVELGFRPELWAPEHGEGDSETVFPMTYENRPNVVAVWKGSGGGRSLILNSHADVVGATDVDDWEHPPFEGVVDGDVVHGRGSVDAKGSLVTFLFALEVLREVGFEPAGDIVFGSVADEEGGGAGAVALAKRYPVDGVLVGEPTDLQILPGTRGAAGLTIRVHGREAHSGTAFEGVNAILKTQKYIQALTELQSRLDAERKHPLWSNYPVAHVFNIATIHGGKFGGVVPELCELVVTCGCIAGESVADLRGWVEEALHSVTMADPWLAANPPDITWTPPAFEASACDPEHPFVRTLAEAATRTLGSKPVVRAMPGGSDLRAFIEAGIPGANFGPGPSTEGHRANEHMDVNEMVKALKVLVKFIPSWTRRQKPRGEQKEAVS